MSKAEILDEIPKLTREDRDEIRHKLDEIDDVLTDEDLAVIDQRLAEHEANSQSAVSWDEFKAQLEQRLGR